LYEQPKRFEPIFLREGGKRSDESMAANFAVRPASRFETLSRRR